LILVLWCCHHGGSAGRHTDLEDVRLTRSAAQLLLVRLRRILWALLRSYYRRCYAAIIGAATQLLSALLRSYYWCGSGAATQLLSALLRSYYRRCYHGGSAGVAVKRGRVRLRRPCREEHEEKDTEKCKRNVLVFPVITA
jgi:hypothetical protein